MSREKQRLFELIEQSFERCKSTPHCSKCTYTGEGGNCFKKLMVDHILENGVIVPSCKIGDNVYSFTESSCEDIDGVHTECEFYGHGIDDRICTIPNGAKCPYQYRVIKCYVTEANILMFTRNWGKTVFLTKEEAEAKMKGGAE